jgi:kynureninase
LYTHPRLIHNFAVSVVKYLLGIRFLSNQISDHPEIEQGMARNSPYMTSPTSFDASLAEARRLDTADPLAFFRNEFVITDPDLVYMDGNSLGRLPRRTISYLKSLIEDEWGTGLIRRWNAGWYDAPARLGDKLGRLLGAAPGQVLVADSTSVDLFKMVMAILSLQPDQTRIVSDVLNFPSDLYILQGCLRLLGKQDSLSLAGSTDDIQPELTELFNLIDQRPTLVTLSHVTFKSGYLYDLAAVTARAHQAGALVLWDLSHSVGVVPMQLDAWGVDFAVGCTYKYLNGGPGAPAFLYVRHEIQEKLISPIWGWFGQRNPFSFSLDYLPADGVSRFLAGTPPVLSLFSLEPALDVVLEAGLPGIRLKSEAITAYAMSLADNILAPLGFAFSSPRQPERRGSHISLRHPEGYRISRALIEEMKVIPDFREPDNIRLGFAPLYTTFEEVWLAVDRIRQLVVDGRYKKYPTDRLAVT